MSARKRGFWIGTVIILLLASFVVASIHRAGKRDAVKVRVEEVRHAPMESWVRAPGRVQPERTVQISSNVQGRVAHLTIAEGDRVSKGDLLLRLDDERYRTQAAQSRARLDAAVANLALAEAQHELALENLRRSENLFEQKLIAVEALQQAQTNAKVEQARRNAAEEEVRSLRASLEQAENDLTETVFRAPMDGMVTALHIEEGENVIPGTMNNPGTVILEIAELDTMEVEAEVDETDVVGVRRGQRARVLVDAFEPAVLSGQVTEIGQSGRSTNAAQQGTQFQVRIRIDDPPPTLRPGMSADVEVLVGSADSAVVVPIQALVAYPPSVVREWREDEAAGRTSETRKRDSEENGDAGDLEDDEEGSDDAEGSGEGSQDGAVSRSGPVSERERPLEGVFVVIDGVARFREVKLGLRSDTHVEVEGVEPGNTVVTGPYKVLRELRGGDAVEVEETDTKPRATT
jgi:HlyD family secretion protein